MSTRTKALWAIEPFHQDKTRITGFHRLLSQLSGENVEAAFVVTHMENELNYALDVPEHQRYTTHARHLVRRALRLGGVRLAESRVHVVDFPTPSVTAAVDCLLGLAKKRKAGLIGLFTHSRRGFARFVLGSFAETAIHRSRVSLLLATPKTTFPPRIRRVFFTSDFNKSSRGQAAQVIETCRRLNAHLTVFHAAGILYDWPNKDDRDALAYRKDVHRERDWLAAQASKAGVGCELLISTRTEQISEAAVALAQKQKADVIAVAAKSGPMTALMGGSITRQIVRLSSLPVLVLK